MEAGWSRLGPTLIGLGVMAMSVLIAWPTLLLLLRESSHKPGVESLAGGITRYPLAPARQIRLLHSALATMVLLTCIPVLGPAILYLAWGYYRPDYFELRSEGLRIVWRLRRTAWIPSEAVTGVELLDGQAFGKRYGWVLVAGAHFLGDFGWTIGKAKLDAYLSRRNGYVLVHRARGKPLLFTPVAPERFVDEAGRRWGRAGS